MSYMKNVVINSLPFEVALTFSKETPLPENENLDTFGVHGYKLSDVNKINIKL